MSAFPLTPYPSRSSPVGLSAHELALGARRFGGEGDENIEGDGGEEAPSLKVFQPDGGSA